MMREYNRGLAAVLGLSAAWLLALCAPALAHTVLVQEFPAEGATLNEQPGRVTLRFNEPVEAAFDTIEVYDERDDRVDEDNARVAPEDAKVVTASLEDLAEGSYRVEWRVTSADGHPVDGKYRFAMGEPAAEANAADNGAGEEDQEKPLAEQQAAGSGSSFAPDSVLGVLLVVAVAVAGLLVLRRRA